jgi:hypothetical protein
MVLIIRIIETLNCNITRPLRIMAALLPFAFIPFKTNTGLKDD